MDHPYYIIPDIKALGKVTDPAKETLHRRRIAANIGDPETLMRILGVTNVDSDGFYPDQRVPELTTADTIDAFLEKFGGAAPVSEVTKDEGPVIPVTPAVDYLTLLEMEEAQTSAAPTEPKTTAETTPGIHPVPPVQPALRIDRGDSKVDETPNLTESFAKVLIKNGNYSRAIEILEQLHLNNPEKSIYFADQVRFLRRLEKLQALRNEKN